MAFSSFLISQMVLDEATDQYAKFYRVDEENMETYKRCCDAFDYLIESADNEDCDLEVQVDDNDLTVEVTLTLPSSISDDGNTQNFGWIAEWALSMETEYADDGRVILHFIFPSLWEEIL